MNRTIASISTLFLASLIFAMAAVANAQWANSSSSYNPYRDPFNTYSDGSSRPLNPGPGGRWNDDEYNSRQNSSRSGQPYTLSPDRGSFDPSFGRSSAPHDFNLYDLPIGQSRLCSQSRQTIVCQ